MAQHPTRRGRPRLQMVDTATRDQSLRFAECRSMGHSWRHRPPIGIDDPSPRHIRRPFGLTVGMIGFLSHCNVCGTDRVRWITRSGEMIVRYEHPDGYERHGDERLTHSEWRRSYVSSVFADYLDHSNEAVAQ